jgi:hypothetical protein
LIFADCLSENSLITPPPSTLAMYSSCTSPPAIQFQIQIHSHHP